MAAVEVTPDFARVPRRNEPVEIVCRKGDLEHSATLVAMQVRGEERWARACAQSDPSAGDLAAGFAVKALEGAMYAFPPLGLSVLAVAAVVAATAAPAEPRYAYQQPPELILAPAAFESEAACNEHFAALKASLEAKADAQRLRINETCHPWPCSASDLNCPNPVCADQRLRVDAELANRLKQLPELRARVRIASP